MQLLKCHLKGKANKKLANEQNIDYSEKRKWASSAPALGLNTIIFKHVYWYSSRSQVSVNMTIGPLVLCFIGEKHCNMFHVNKLICIVLYCFEIKRCNCVKGVNKAKLCEES